MTPDPLVDTDQDLQAFNRYSYVSNNPLAYTDPTGYLKFRLGPIKISISNSDLRMIAGIAAAYFVGYNFMGTEAGIFGKGMGFANSLAGGFAGGVVAGGGFEGGIQGAFSAGLFYGAGFVGAEGSLGRIAAHAVAGCVSSAAGGGDCGSGALSGGFANFAGQFTQGMSFEGQLVAKAVIGGTASAIGGGKFANGAVTGAFGHLFNDGQPEHQSDSFGKVLRDRLMSGEMRDDISRYGSGDFLMDMAMAPLGGPLAGTGTRLLSTATLREIPVVAKQILSVDQALDAAVKFLGAAPRELGKAGSGVFRSADGTRQFRMTSGDIGGVGSPLGPHVHFEKIDRARGTITNIHVKIR